MVSTFSISLLEICQLRFHKEKCVTDDITFSMSLLEICHLRLHKEEQCSKQLKRVSPICAAAAALSTERERTIGLLHYPLRSAAKPKEVKPPAPESPNSSASKKERSSSSVSKSIGVLDVFVEDKSVKPSRRLSIPAKSTASPVRKTVGNITPISEARTRRSANNQLKIETPVSDILKSSIRRRFSVLSSSSYWLSQIKLSEAAAKHSISLGLFKLALEAGCEPLMHMKDELKSYVRRHNLFEPAETVKLLFESYNIENFEQLQVSETCSYKPGEGNRSSDDDARNASSVKLKPKSQKVESVEAPPVKESSGKTTKNCSVTRTKGSMKKSSAISRNLGAKTQKKLQKPNKEVADKKDQIKKQEKEAPDKEDPISPSPTEEVNENKENMDVPKKEDISDTNLAEV